MSFRSPRRRPASFVTGLFGALLLLGGCASTPDPAMSQTSLEDLLSVDQIAERYVRLVLAVGEHDSSYVDAYYGPAAWREEATAAKRSLAEIGGDAESAIARLAMLPPPDEPIARLRLGFLRRQLAALATHVRTLGGERLRFDDEAEALYDTRPPPLDRAALDAQLRQLEALLPGAGTLGDRYNAYLQRFAIPPERLESVMRVAIDEARRRTARRIRLPDGEQFELALVSGKSWSAYNWYQGNFHSRIEINTDLPVTASRVIELAVHEGYPGHHVYNSLLERALVRERGWIEYSVYPLFSPQSLIAEGSADFAIELAFSGEERAAFYQEVLFPLAGFDPAEARRYAQVTDAGRITGMPTIAAARDWIDGRANDEQTIARLRNEALASPERARQRIAFFRDYRSYIVNYALGEQLVARYVNALAGNDAALRWLVFADLLASPALPSDLAVPAPKAGQ